MKFREILFCLLFIAVFLRPGLSEAEDPAGPALSLDSLAIPKSLGKIEERFHGTSSRWVIQIQDIHAHFTAQENIAAIIDHLNAVYGIRTLALEGGWDETRFEKSWGLPSSQEKQMLARSLMEEEYITGSAYAGLFSQTPLHLIGIEDQALYEQNRRLYLEHLAVRDPVLTDIQALQSRLEDMKQSLYGPELKAFDRLLSAYRAGHKSDEFFPALLKLSAEKDIALSDLSQVMIFEKLTGMEKAINQEKLKSEAERLMKEFRRKRLTFEELLRSGIIPAERLEFYPAARAYLEMMRVQDELSYPKFFEEIETAISRLKEKLMTTDEEKALDARWERFLTAKKLMEFEAVPDTLTDYQASAPEILEEMKSEGLEAALDLALRFYETVTQRDKVFSGAVAEDPRLAGDLVMVAGGFHTSGISRLLRDAGISFVVITPDLGGEAPDMNVYFDRLRDEAVNNQTLSATQNRFFTAEFDRRFQAGVLALKRDRDVFNAVKIVTSGPVPETAFPAFEAHPFRWEDFEALPVEEKRARLRQWWVTSRTGNIHMALMVTARDLTALLQDPVSRAIWREVREEPANMLILIYQNPADIPTEAIGGRFKVLRIRGESVPEAAASEQFQTRFRPALEQKVVAAILPEGGMPDTRILELSVHPASLLYRIFLSNPELRQLAQNPEVLNSILQIFSEIENLEAFLRAA